MRGSIEDICVDDDDGCGEEGTLYIMNVDNGLNGWRKGMRERGDTGGDI